MPVNGSNAIDQVTAGVSAPEKAVILDKNSKIDALDITALKVSGTPVSGNVVAGATAVAGAEDNSDVTVAVQLLNAEGDPIDFVAAVKFYLATDAAGTTPLGTPTDGGIAAGTDGAIIETLADLAGIAISEADGDIDIVVTDSGAHSAYLVIVLPSGALVVSNEIVHEA